MFELSAYQESDIDTWAHQFYGRHYTPSLINVNVDGGPLNPVCPAGDTCPPDFDGYSGDIEVDADIEMSLAISPAARHIIVYNAPNDKPARPRSTSTRRSPTRTSPTRPARAGAHVRTT